MFYLNSFAFNKKANEIYYLASDLLGIIKLSTNNDIFDSYFE